jgi:hypothetical protein
MGKLTEQSIFKGRRTNGQKTHEEMLNIPGHKGKVNQNHVRFHSFSWLALQLGEDLQFEKRLRESERKCLI